MFFGIAGLSRAYGAVSQAFSVISVVIRTSEPDRYIVNPIHQMPRLKHLGQNGHYLSRADLRLVHAPVTDDRGARGQTPEYAILTVLAAALLVNLEVTLAS
ncbi:hypothetical protein FHS94_001715 [Sphingomonas aerophila]|jgi:hypothetical protein|uniref:Uncharacterized protein n=1 Tax=Sphingomonas aerophila TaxID=1344948 RepID=A0A7W9BCT3_9SPHN|nr:hypothetical protein [Sphingomonas aerophila]